MSELIVPASEQIPRLSARAVELAARLEALAPRLEAAREREARAQEDYDRIMAQHGPAQKALHDALRATTRYGEGTGRWDGEPPTVAAARAELAEIEEYLPLADRKLSAALVAVNELKEERDRYRTELRYIEDQLPQERARAERETAHLSRSRGLVERIRDRLSGSATPAA